MSGAGNLLVFSDLDGTLLEHDTYSWAPAAPALDLLRRTGAGLILASSKTGAEMAALRYDMGFQDWPAIIENGCGILPPHENGLGHDSTYVKLRDVIARLPTGFRGFGDMSAEELTERTSLAFEAALRAKLRRFSEPGLWLGDENGLQDFLSALKDAGLVAQRGGRFLTLSFGGTKADQMDALIKRFKPSFTIALGDAPNDIEMIKRADYGVIVANPASPQLPDLPGEISGHIQRTSRVGPSGWADAVTGLVEDLTNTKDQNAHG